MTGTEMMQETIWFDQPKYEESECHYQLYLANKNGPTPASQASSLGASSLIAEITKARENIKQSLNEAQISSQGSGKSASALESENKELRNLLADLTKRMSCLETRMSKIEGSSPSSAATTAPTTKAAEVKKDEEDDDDFDLFASSDEEEEVDEESEKIKAERVAKYHEKKGKKPALVPKSNILLDIKPWADDTDMVEVERLVREIVADGLVWGSSKLVPVAYGIKKLQISCVVEDDKIGTDFLEEAITAFDDHVQSMDVAAFNKV